MPAVTVGNSESTETEMRSFYEADCDGSYCFHSIGLHIYLFMSAVQMRWMLRQVSSGPPLTSMIILCSPESLVTWPLLGCCLDPLRIRLISGEAQGQGY